MENQKTTIAENIKKLVSALQVEIANARAANLNVEIDIPYKGKFGCRTDEVSVKIFEEVTY